MVQLCRVAERRDAGVTAVGLCTFNGRGGEADESRWAASQESAVRFYGFSFDLY